MVSGFTMSCVVVSGVMVRDVEVKCVVVSFFYNEWCGCELNDGEMCSGK